MTGIRGKTQHLLQKGAFLCSVQHHLQTGGRGLEATAVLQGEISSWQFLRLLYNVFYNLITPLFISLPIQRHMVTTTQKLMISVSSALEGHLVGADVAVQALYLASTALRKAQTSADKRLFSMRGAPQLH